MAGAQTSPNSHPDQYPLQPNVEFIFTSDESWSHIEDMALRRRIQNKAAQRRYRRKIREQAASTAGHRIPVPLTMEPPPDLPWYPNSAQGPNTTRTREHTPALSWNPETSAFRNGTPSEPWQYQGQDDLLFPPSGDLSRPSSASSCFSANAFSQDAGYLDQTERGFYGALPIDDPFLAVGVPERNFQSSPLPLCSKDTNADRLAKRIKKTLDELSLLYDIGIELELVPQDNDMFTQLESLKKAFCKAMKVA
ncbi:uncharacterized protein ACHE_40496A [Aspergillus chevalieri]|uniref:BZIP domain-containing protein n=1 Tax=Aspergillus chevalieri TaxID=182096 RepID=A0A7R7ZP38_ASPCH|nr:uncharacterized protein ACHE_40496A [Aspergillus chevalieri]BCR87932.1 hypothetical protein ACHE_40496A [Aspergillus chevalieri]